MSRGTTVERASRGLPFGILAGMRFRTRVELGGKTATGLQIPDDVLAALGSGKRPAVRITIGGHTYRTTVASRLAGSWCR
jgi:hypothetical protein